MHAYKWAWEANSGKVSSDPGKNLDCQVAFRMIASVQGSLLQLLPIKQKQECV